MAGTLDCVCPGGRRHFHFGANCLQRDHLAAVAACTLAARQSGAYTITAVGTEGERIQSFVEPEISPFAGSLGIHNVAWAAANFPTPFKTSHTPPLFEPSWAAYDSFFLFGDAFEPPLSESNDGTTTGMLGLIGPFGIPRSGFGTFTSGLGPPILVTPAGSNIPLMQVVMRRGDFALFDIEVRAEGGSVLAAFDDFLIGVPEPSSIAPLVVPLLGLFTKYRLRDSSVKLY